MQTEPRAGLVPRQRGSEPLHQWWPDISRRAWFPFLVVGLVAGAVAGFIGDEAAVTMPLNLLGFLTAVTIFAGVRRNRPSRPLPWHLIALCTALTTIGMGVLPSSG